MQNIFVVEDDSDISELISYALKGANFNVFTFESGADLFLELEKKEHSPSLVILDIMLPGDDGLAILRKLKQSAKYSELPTMMLSAKGSELDKVKGLDTGADDYMTKPFSVMELIARVNALLRRFKSSSSDILSLGSIVLDKGRHTVMVSGHDVVLTLKEYDLLAYLLSNKEVVLGRDRIIEVVWGYDFQGESRTIDMHIKTLRQKLGDEGKYIQTVRGVGYKIGE